MYHATVCTFWQDKILAIITSSFCVRDLIVDMTQFYDNYEKVKPFLVSDGNVPPARENLQSPDMTLLIQMDFI